MKKLIVCTVLLVMLVCAGCADNSANVSDKPNDDTLPDYVTMIQDGKWPENDYTAGLPVPDGKMEWGMVDSENNTCSISITDMDEAAYQKFMQDIGDIGFSTQHSVSEEIKGEGYVSSGTILSDGNKCLSIAYENQNMTLMISMVDHAK